MEVKNNAVEANTQTAATEEGVETNQVAPSDTDLLKLLADKDAELAKIKEERENYKRGMLIAKGKTKEDDEDAEGKPSVQELVRQAVREEMLSSKEQAIINEKDEIIKKALREKDELITTLKNRSQISTTGQGGSTETTTVVSDGILSEEKIQQLKKTGKSDAWIEAYKKNLMKNRGFAN